MWAAGECGWETSHYDRAPSILFLDHSVKFGTFELQEMNHLSLHLEYPHLPSIPQDRLGLYSEALGGRGSVHPRGFPNTFSESCQ